ncbi:uncharacterized protein LOC130641579 [Hydractinia symbiolongicarpus]|uniref:uncharacterized protein LOC130641579 n=1 Tax=Hydractinia symbiolongicarpus TaxID=13093 RepID=UPI00254F75E8|nr:uncharacterized protein LOC130641579 [Hydractinia symbiolongicarpus]
MALTARQIILLLLLRRRMKRKNTRVAKRRFWVRQIYKERKIKGEYHLLVQDLKLFDRELFFRHFRMTPSKLEELLGYVGPLITKSSLKREAISASERLCVTMRYLVTGDAQTTIADSYRMGKNTVSGIVKETANAIWKFLVAQGFLQAPSTEKDWIKIADDFEKRGRRETKRRWSLCIKPSWTCHGRKST